MTYCVYSKSMHKYLKENIVDYFDYEDGKFTDCSNNFIISDFIYDDFVIDNTNFQFLFYPLNELSEPDPYDWMSYGYTSSPISCIKHYDEMTVFDVVCGRSEYALPDIRELLDFDRIGYMVLVSKNNGSIKLKTFKEKQDAYDFSNLYKDLI